jgi:hypothetical protein
VELHAARGADGKRPIKKGWESAPRESLDVALAWAAEGNVGLRTGLASGVVVIDSDTPDCPLTLPQTPTVITARGGKHFYFTVDPSSGPVRNSVSTIARKVDVKGDRGQVVFPGSRNPATGGEYRWAPGLSPEDVAFAELPYDVLELNWKPAEARAMREGGKVLREIAEELGVGVSTIRRWLEDDAARAPARTEDLVNGVSKLGELPVGAHGAPPLGAPARTTKNDVTPYPSFGAPARTDAARTARHLAPPPPQRTTKSTHTPPPHPGGRKFNYAQTALKEECDAVASARQPGRNDALNRAAFNLGQLVGAGVLGRSLVEYSLYQAAEACGLVKDDGETAVRATMRSGLDSGFSNPRQLPPSTSRPPSLQRPPTPSTTSTPPVTPSIPRYVLIPGAHTDDTEAYLEIGSHHFSEDVVANFPPDTLYRRHIIPGEIVGEPGVRKFIPLGNERARILVDSNMRLGKWGKVKGGEHDGEHVCHFIPCSKDLASLVIEHTSTHPAIRNIRLISNHPVYLPGWQLATPGYSDGVYYDEPPELQDLQPETDSNFIQQHLSDLLIDFPFHSEADRQNFIGLLLTPIIRPAIADNVPLHLILAPLERTGKSKLAEQVLGVIVRGEKVDATTMPEHEEEFEKRVTSLLVEGESIIHLDNIREFVDSAVLASLLTANTVKGRLLGQSKMLRLPNTLTVVGSGNNVKATGEIVKRTIPIVLQPKDDRPEERRDFVHPDLENYLRSVRKITLQCLLGMVEIWKASGRRKHPRRLGGFERWSETVGGIMQACGFSEWRENEQQWRRDANPRGEDMRLLVDAWWSQKKYWNAELQREVCYETTTDEVTELARSLGIFPDVFLSNSTKGQQTAMARRVLAPHIDTPIGGFLVRKLQSGSNSKYRLEVSEVMGGAK